MFKFNFQPQEINEKFDVPVTESTTAAADEPPAQDPCVECIEIQPTAEQLALTPDALKHGLILFAGGQEILHKSSDALLEELVEQQIQQRLIETKSADDEEADASRANQHRHTDLVPGVYEGGGKIWECTQDLGDYLSQKDETTDSSWLESNITKDSVVLDLGCGAGILGLLALQHGADVHFQDYNSEIISKVTIPNVMLNIHPNDDIDAESNTVAGTAAVVQRSHFFAGDWSHFVQLHRPQQVYDVILTCETIYNPANNQKIIDVLKSMLRPETGVCFLAAKTYYFGVGGGLRAFESLLAADGTLRSQVVWQSTKNVQREILRIEHRSNEQKE